MKRYKLKKHNDYYVLFRYLYLDRSVGVYRVLSGTRKEILAYMNKNKIKVGINYG